MKIAAVADIHGDETLPDFRQRLAALPAVDLFLLGGDITDANDLSAFGRAVEAMRQVHRGPVVAIFGNNEYAPDHPKYRARFPDITFLDDEAADLHGPGGPLRVVGTTGSLDKPTWWQSKNVPGIEKLYGERVGKVRRLLSEGPRPRILLTHYAPTYRTMVGERKWYWDQLGSAKYEEVILETLPAAVLHGHVHNGKPFVELLRQQRTLEDSLHSPSVPIYNIAFAERREITVVDLPGS